MDFLSSHYTLKEISIKEPDLYLGARISKHMILRLDDPTKTRLAMSSEDYIKSTISNLETELDKIHFPMPKKVETPLSSGYIPEIDSSRKLTPR